MKPFCTILLAGFALRAADCVPSHLSEQETLARFQERDRAAQAAMDRGQYAAAAHEYREAACLAPKSARAYYGLGIAEAAAGNFAAARKALETAYAILPDNVMPLAMLVRVNVAMKDTEQVKAVLRTAAQRFPKDAELHSGLARFLAENQILDLALAESLRFRQAGATDSAAAAPAESLSFRQAGATDSAAVAPAESPRFRQAGASDPAAAVALAVLENTVGAYEDAIRDATSVESAAGAADAVKASAAGVAGLSYESIGQREEAIKHLKLAIQLAPAQENSYLALAYLYEKARKFKDAVEVLQQARRQIPGSPNFLLPLGNNLVWAEDYQAGIEILNELIRRAPDTSEAYVRLAEAYRNTGRPEFEAEALRRLARVKPDYPMVHVLTARALLSIEPIDGPAILAELAQAEKTAPTDADIFYLRGKVYGRMDRHQDAVAALKRAIELRPMDSAAYYQLGLTYRKLGQTELARNILERMQHLKQTPAGR